MKSVLTIVIGVFLLILFSGCNSKEQIKKTLIENPEILAEVIKENPVIILDAFSEASLEYREKKYAEKEDLAAKEREQELKNPKNPKIDPSRVVFGKPEAPITIVEYSDFQCPFCARGAQRIKQLKEKYGEKVRVVYKHLPIRSEHPHAQITAQYFEAVGLQDPVKAEKFHDLIFENQDKLINGGEEYLKTVIKDIGVSYSKIQLDLNSEVVLERIKADEAEAEAFGLSSTPSFLINGVTLKGAAPIEEFILIIDQLKLNL